MTDSHDTRPILDFEIFHADVCVALDLTADELPVDAKFVDDLGFDSLLVYELIVVVEEQCDVYLGDEPLDIRAWTLRDVYEHVCLIRQHGTSEHTIEGGDRDRVP